MNNNSVSNLVMITFTALLVIVAAFLLPWRSINWGTLSMQPAQTVTVSGSAKNEVKNQIARFNAGIHSVSDNKDTAVSEVNQKIANIIEAVNGFGISKADIKTQNMSIYQEETTYYDNGVEKRRPGQWRVSNDVEVKLRDVDRAAELADLLAGSGANNVYGPNFTMDDTSQAEKDLMAQALEDARAKAQILAQSSGRKLGKIINISEGVQDSNIPMYRMEGGGGGGGASIEPGTGTVQKSITVVFEIR